MLFRDIPGLERIKERLIAAHKRSQVAHAQLFAGSEGSAALPLALAWATYLNCENPGAEDACGECSSCRKMQGFVHPDLHFVYPVSSTKEVKSTEAISITFVKQWRKFLLENPYGNITDWSMRYGGENKQVNISREESRQIIKNLSLKSFEGAYKVMLIWLPEYMHPSAANGILKILEEPAPHTVFLLVTQQADRLLTTITSRTQRIQVPLFNDEEVTNLLTDKYGLELTEAQKVALLSEGNISEALRLSASLDNDLFRFFADWMRSCYSRKIEMLIDFSEQYHKQSKTAQKSILQYSLNMLREVILWHQLEGQLNKTQGAERDFIEKFSQVMDEGKTEAIVAEIEKNWIYLERNASPKILFLDLSLYVLRVLAQR
ncbi:MAG: DNA polymerase III subunit delta [Cyclobacteriaceae bacterium]|nr:DNA polymerase III subunit delta [Cyclobacteriaceae bacterium]MCH8515889.1 DNA polymerase III subunit delta [Cyclobacteriaceae bacterium]